MLSEGFHNEKCYNFLAWFKRNESYRASSSTEHNKANYDHWKMNKRQWKCSKMRLVNCNNWLSFSPLPRRVSFSQNTPGCNRETDWCLLWEPKFCLSLLSLCWPKVSSSLHAQWKYNTNSALVSVISMLWFSFCSLGFLSYYKVIHCCIKIVSLPISFEYMMNFIKDSVCKLWW